MNEVVNDCLIGYSLRLVDTFRRPTDGGGNGGGGGGAGSLMQCLEGGSEAGKGHEMSFCGGGGKRKMKVARASNHAPLHPDLVNHIHTPV